MKTGSANDNFVPVVFADTAGNSGQGDDDLMQLNADSTPVEDFGAGQEDHRHRSGAG